MRTTELKLSPCFCLEQQSRCGLQEHEQEVREGSFTFNKSLNFSTLFLHKLQHWSNIMVPGTPSFWTALAGELHTFPPSININPLLAKAKAIVQLLQFPHSADKPGTNYKPKELSRNTFQFTENAQGHSWCRHTHHGWGKLRVLFWFRKYLTFKQFLELGIDSLSSKRNPEGISWPTCPTGASSLTPDTCSSVPMCKTTPSQDFIGFRGATITHQSVPKFHHLTPTTHPKCSGWPEVSSAQRWHRSHPALLN